MSAFPEVWLCLCGVCLPGESQTGNHSLPSLLLSAHVLYAVNMRLLKSHTCSQLLLSFSVSLFHTHTHVCMHVCMHTHKHKCTRLHTHTHTLVQAQMVTCSLLQTKAAFICVPGPGCPEHRTPERVWELLILIHSYSAATEPYKHIQTTAAQWHKLIGVWTWLVAAYSVILL